MDSLEGMAIYRKLGRPNPRGNPFLKTFPGFKRGKTLATRATKYKMVRGPSSLDNPFSIFYPRGGKGEGVNRGYVAPRPERFPKMFNNEFLAPMFKVRGETDENCRPWQTKRPRFKIAPMPQMGLDIIGPPGAKNTSLQLWPLILSRWIEANPGGYG